MNCLKKGKVLLTAFYALVVGLFVNGQAHAALTEPTMPDSTSVIQKMVDTFGTAGTYGIVIIGGAVALGVLCVLAMWAWRLAKKWLSTAK